MVDLVDCWIDDFASNCYRHCSVSYDQKVSIQIVFFFLLQVVPIQW